jgi:hypothetical protein
MPEAERTEVREILAGYGVQGEALDNVVAAITGNPKRWVDRMERRADTDSAARFRSREGKIRRR